jgi:hypothetical protein
LRSPATADSDRLCTGWVERCGRKYATATATVINTTTSTANDVDITEPVNGKRD